jgi:hypothetical protein
MIKRRGKTNRIPTLALCWLMVGVGADSQISAQVLDDFRLKGIRKMDTGASLELLLKPPPLRLRR